MIFSTENLEAQCDDRDSRVRIIEATQKAQTEQAMSGSSSNSHDKVPVNSDIIEGLGLLADDFVPCLEIGDWTVRFLFSMRCSVVLNKKD